MGTETLYNIYSRPITFGAGSRPTEPHISQETGVQPIYNDQYLQDRKEYLKRYHEQVAEKAKAQANGHTNGKVK